MMGMIGQISPVRIQLKRKRGWRMPANTVVVSRPSKWGNPHFIGFCPVCGIVHTENGAVFAFRFQASELTADKFDDLRGKNLACWCRLCPEHKDGKPLGVECAKCAPCHADWLLEMANS
jgi:hypothetical protein